ncbi:hypothetical protein G6O69_32130 [Pseudenhygromyxa sp. WMMC2535]|uniref:ATP-grasp domain-containing protein n=1 Tax=Pseudenhygromyxa sp. WMMC2535 TaxID=2712867 RepID=UPI0015543B35|nr:hypothetical protein [Pseudenhygromyxa sp. WMMC2535]NVB42516.1 hypothetical protein [Pseudenhygromyxa sp. WMMC2535]
MAESVRKIGLSLGADLCWPACYEAIMRRLDLRVPSPVPGESGTLRFEVERVTIEPYDLRQPCSYDLVIDRLTHWFHTSREWIKKAVIMNDLYVFNNPWSVQSMEKHTAYAAMMHLGMPVPDTWMIPPKSYATTNPDLRPTLMRYARLFDIGKLGPKLGYPMFVKPYDGGGWRSVRKVDDEAELRAAYEDSGADVMHVQAGILPHDGFVRSVGLGPQVRHVSYDPDQPLHDRYRILHYEGLGEDDLETLRKVTLTINTFFGWEFNSCESLRQGGVWHPMDFANACPDSQVTSLHYHFPWLVKAYIRWSLFCAATDRPMRRTLDWAPYYEIAASDRSYAEKLDAYGAIADERLETARFEEFCAEHLGELDAVAADFFASDEARAAVRDKVAALFPKHEIEEFTALFWDRIQQWRREEGEG